MSQQPPPYGQDPSGQYGPPPGHPGGPPPGQYGPPLDSRAGRPPYPEVVDEAGTEAVAVLEGGDNTYQVYLVKQQSQWLIQELNIDTNP